MGSWPERQRVRRLVVGLRPGDLRLPAADAHVLGLVAPLLAQTLRARALAADLSEARGQVITAVEEERRAAPGPARRARSAAFWNRLHVRRARNLLRTDPEAAGKLLVTLRQETVTAIDDFRSLVYAMRPPALDELGQLPALHQQAYRIVVEALTNVPRHSGCAQASVRLGASDGSLDIEILRDDGQAITQLRAGVGVSSMHERAAELRRTRRYSAMASRIHARTPTPRQQIDALPTTSRGTLQAGGTPTGGRVLACLPLGAG